MELFHTFQDSYLGIYTKSFVWQTENFNVFIDSGLLSGAEKKMPFLDNGRQSILLLTHGHWDHIGCNSLIQKHGGKVYAHQRDLRHLQDYQWHWKVLFEQFKDDFDLPAARHTVFWESVGDPIKPDKFFVNGEDLCFDDLVFHVVEIPGHSMGSVCFLEKNSGILFSGDGIIGKGFFTGVPQIADFDSYIDSMNMLSSLHAEKIVTDHTDVWDGKELQSLCCEGIQCATEMITAVKSYVCKTQGSLSVGDAARAIAQSQSKNTGGGACVSAIAALRKIKDNPRAVESIRSYIDEL